MTGNFKASTAFLAIKLSVLPSSTRMSHSFLLTVPLVRNKVWCWLASMTRGVVHSLLSMHINGWPVSSGGSVVSSVV